LIEGFALPLSTTLTGSDTDLAALVDDISVEMEVVQ
jgi:hypothetical protein